jgi:phosphate transport system substrate-binding protein
MLNFHTGIPKENAMRRIGTMALVAVGFAVALTGCGGGGSSNSGTDGGGPPRITGGGSSFVAPMMKVWASVYADEKKGEVDYNSSGSGAGVTDTVNRSIDFGCTDAPMNPEQLAKAGGEDKIVHIPLIMGAVVPVYNVPEAQKPIQFTGPVLAKIFLGTIEHWDDPALKELNPDAGLPHEKIKVVHRDDPSGTTYIFTDYLSKVSEDWANGPGKGMDVKWKTGAGAKKSDGVAGFINNEKHSIGYVELLYALNKKGIKYGSVKNAEGEFVMGSLKGVEAAAATLTEKDIPGNLCFSFTNAVGKESYPISGTTWAVVLVKQPAAKAKAIKDFLSWVTTDGQKLTNEKHYAALPKVVQEKIAKKLESIKAE